MKTLKKTQNTKEKIKKELDESIVIGGKHNNIEIDEKTRMIEKLEDAATQLFESSSRSLEGKKNSVWLTYQHINNI